MNKIAKKLREGLTEIAIVGTLGVAGFTIMTTLDNCIDKYFPQEKRQETSFKHIYPELDLGVMDWTKYLLIR